MLVLLIAGVAGTFQARADVFVFQWLDNNDAVGLRGVTYQNGVVIQDVNVGAESYAFSYGLWNGGTLDSSFDVSFNIYDPDGVTLSDTWHIFGTQGDTSFGTPFVSDTETTSVSSLSNAVSLVETGDLQTVFNFTARGGQDSYTLQFVSDVDTVPEPGSILLLGTVISLTYLSIKRRRGRRYTQPTLS